MGKKSKLGEFWTLKLFQIRAHVISARKAKHLDAKTMFTYSHANTPIGQSERVYYLSDFISQNVNTQNVKIERRDRPHILASNWCETFENLLLLHWRELFQGFYTQKIEQWFLSVSGAHDSVSINIHSFFVADQDTAWYSICSAQEKSVSLTEPYTTHS